MRDFTRREFLKMSGIGVGAMALAACGGGGASSSTPSGGNAGGGGASSAGGADMGLGQQQGSLVAEGDVEFTQIASASMGISIMPATLVPFRNTSYQRGLIFRYLYDRLAYLTNTGEYVPQGAKSWTVAADGTTWTVELYDYITDSVGNPVTADDVIWFINTSKERATKPCFQQVKEMKKISDSVIEMHMTMDIADNFEVVLESTYMIAQASYEASKDEMATDVISASPFVVTNFTADSEITFETRDDYWQTEDLIHPTCQGNIKTFTQRYISEASQMQIALETGTVDAYPGINATVVTNFKDNDDFIVTMGPGNNNTILEFSGDQSKLIARDLNLRMAICYCINVDMLIQAACNGYGEAAHDFIPRTSGGYNPAWEKEEYFPYDVAKAQEYLAQSDYNGEELVLAGTNSSEKAYTIIQACCQAIGIKVKLDLQDMALWTVNGNDGRLWDMSTVSTGNGGANMWAQNFDGTVYEYGDKMARKDSELNDLIHYTWQVNNYTPENIQKVHEYLRDHAYAYGLYLPYTLSVVSSKLGLVETEFNVQGMIDIVASRYEKK